MMSFIHYISAVRRLTEIEKTVRMLKSNKYSEADVPPMVLAQRDFIKKEMEYFKESCIGWLFGIVIGLMIVVFVYVIWGNHV